MTHAPADLFGTAAPGPALAHDIVSEREERTLLKAIDGIELPRFQFQQWTSNRRTATFGWQYDFNALTFTPVEPVPAFLLPLRARAAGLVGLDAEELVQALVIRYDPGAGIGWHRDRPEFRDVIGVSLGAPATMRFRRRRPEGGFDRVSVKLPARSMYHMIGEFRDDWEHSIPAMEATRWSVTFRNLSALGQEKGR